MTCEVIHVVPGMDGEGLEEPCRNVAVATDENGIRVCGSCGKAEEAEGFVVTWDDSAKGGAR